MIYECEYFSIKELIPPELYFNTRLKYKLWLLFDVGALLTLDALRKRYGRMTVNNWKWGGDMRYRGYRLPGCTVGSEWSQHKRGAAFDCSFKIINAAELRADIKQMSKEELNKQGLQHIRRIEDDVKWFHFDTGNWVGEGIKFFKP